MTRLHASGVLSVLCLVVLGLGLQERVRLEPVLADPSRLALDWRLDGSGQWAIGKGLLTLTRAGTPAGPIRRPSAIAILDGPAFGEVSVEVDVRSTAPGAAVTPRRDVLLIAGYQSPTRFYYAHISAMRDDVHNGIFLVADADRRRIDSASSVAPLVDQAWHRARIEREPRSGRLAVFFDEREAPIMTAEDTTLSWGRVGVGSFDDTAEFRAMRVEGVVAVEGGVTSAR